MTLIAKEFLLQPGRHTQIASAPEGLYPLVIAHLVQSLPGGLLHVARDDARMTTLIDGLRFFAPELEVIDFPAWDCLPYDRVSPHPDIVSRRVATLSRLAGGPTAPTPVVVTTVNAILQRTPARAILAHAAFVAKVGDEISRDALTRFLSDNGYQRTGTVMESGEFAIRGGIVDLFPPGTDDPLRLDLFGDQLEGIRTFDPISQRTLATVSSLHLIPAREVGLDGESIARFRGGYSALFGIAGEDDALYAAVSQGRPHMGMENWLPLFQERLETLLDYLPDAIITLDHLVGESSKAHAEAVADYYEARQTYSAGGAKTGAIYKPLPPDRLYLAPEEWARLLKRRTVGAFSPYHTPADDESVVDARGREGHGFAPERADPQRNVFDAVGDYVRAAQGRDCRVVITCYSDGARDRLARLLADHGIDPLAVVDSWSEAERLPPETTALAVFGLERGFEASALSVIGEQDILGTRIARPPRRQRRAENFIAEASELSSGDLVIHIDHGIGRYTDLQTLDVQGAAHDCLCLVYAGGDRLFIPVENVEVLSRYGSEDTVVELDRLGGAAWQSRKARVKKRLTDNAGELIKLAAQRETQSADTYSPPPGLYEEFCARFPYHETEDQQRAIDEVTADLAAGKPMDRLVCGDVGFGKTEVALRSSFVAVMEGKQVALVCPTTLLARQHFQTFSERFAGLPVRIGRLSRLVATKEAQATKEGLTGGDVDIVIGTHALLAKGIQFRDLGLLIIDEEQHFGVTHKERLKQLRANVHVLTLTATPIPRTLQLALSGVRELSLIGTPPVDRLAIRTYILPFDPLVVRQAILREHYRGGQCFYICPRIKDLADAAQFLKDKVPEVTFAMVHGRLPARQLEQEMSAFYDGSYTVLVSTDIIESGLDIPAANTIIVHRADLFGLAQLYQLRGRVGRSKVRAYAYLTLPPGRVPTAGAEKRLQVMQALDGLGAGFSLASHDLDIRGAGNLLGEAQSGHIREVGLELYQHMLEEAVAAARYGEDAAPGDDTWSPQINIGTSVLIPESYVGDLDLRMALYRRLSRLEGQAEIDAFAAELIDRFGPLPSEVDNLLDIISIKRLCREAGIEKLDAGPKGATLSFRSNKFTNPAGLVEFISRQADTTKLRPDHRLVYMRSWEDMPERLSGVQHLLATLAGIASQGEGVSAATGEVDSASLAISSKT